MTRTVTYSLINVFPWTDLCAVAQALNIIYNAQSKCTSCVMKFSAAFTFFATTANVYVKIYL